MKPDHAKALDVLKSRDGDPLFVELKSGISLTVFNIGWVYDKGNDVAHISTNDSPTVEDEYGISIEAMVISFWADEVVRITDEADRAILFEANN